MSVISSINNSEAVSDQTVSDKKELPSIPNELVIGLRESAFRMFQCNVPGIDCSEPSEVFGTVANWYVKYHASRFGQFAKPKKGLIIFGKVGCGKTTITRALMKGPRFKNTDTPQWTIPFFRAYKMSSDYREAGDVWWNAFKDKFKDDLILDDLGSEERASWMGNRWTLGEFIKWRYEMFVERGSLTVISTNFTSFEEIGDYYTQWMDESPSKYYEKERISSRIQEMCHSIIYEHNNRRLEN